jgi:hypothetical protein
MIRAKLKVRSCSRLRDCEGELYWSDHGRSRGLVVLLIFHVVQKSTIPACRSDARVGRSKGMPRGRKSWLVLQESESQILHRTRVAPCEVDAAFEQYLRELEESSLHSTSSLG